MLCTATVWSGVVEEQRIYAGPQFTGGYLSPIKFILVRPLRYWSNLLLWPCCFENYTLCVHIHAKHSSVPLPDVNEDDPLWPLDGVLFWDNSVVHPLSVEWFTVVVEGLTLLTIEVSGTMGTVSVEEGQE